MRVHGDLGSPALDFAPVAPFVGPFAGREFIDVWWRCVGTGDALHVVETDDAAIVVVDADGEIRFAGDAHLTDYHSPLGSGAVDLIRRYAMQLAPGTAVRFDSLPSEAVEVVVKGLEDAGLSTSITDDEVAAVMSLPGSPEDYLASLGKKQRHEVRRKRRRFAEALGSPRFAEGGAEDFEAFVRMHRASPGEKGRFMTADYETFFKALIDNAGARLDVLRGDADAALAVAVGFDVGDSYYLYNSAYDPAVADASPGIVLVAGLIDRAIRAGKTRFDFLKGDEIYKFRLGATARPLFVVEATR